MKKYLRDETTLTSEDKLLIANCQKCISETFTDEPDPAVPTAPANFTVEQEAKFTKRNYNFHMPDEMLRSLKEYIVIKWGYKFNKVSGIGEKFSDISESTIDDNAGTVIGTKFVRNLSHVEDLLSDTTKLEKVFVPDTPDVDPDLPRISR